MVGSVSDRYGNEVNSATCYFRIIGRLILKIYFVSL